jgi:DNA modification methylase
MAKRPFVNKLNDLSPKEWLKFQKSWFVHNPPPRQKNVLRHPAKFPETLAMEFISFFTKKGGMVLDPMAGTGSTLIAALRMGRHSFGIELNPVYADIARQAIEMEKQSLDLIDQDVTCEIFTGDAANTMDIVVEKNFQPVDYIFTSPPYWDMLHARGASTQKHRRSSQELDVFYSDNPADLGNISDYDSFIEKLSTIYDDMNSVLKPGGYMTVIVKNVKKGGRIYPLAWDLANRLNNSYELKDEKIWCQDNQHLSPYGLGNAWVSNTFHHYCLQFKKR